VKLAAANRVPELVLAARSSEEKISRQGVVIIAGITDPTGRVLAVMPHPERGMFTWQRDDYDRLKDKAQRNGQKLPLESDGMALFRNAAAYFEISKKKTA
jgi:phosphoribosylformylglycinamidine (FGAM) synthase-like amidotransferase family enzyme